MDFHMLFMKSYFGLQCYCLQNSYQKENICHVWAYVVICELAELNNFTSVPDEHKTVFEEQSLEKKQVIV